MCPAVAWYSGPVPRWTKLPRIRRLPLVSWPASLPPAKTALSPTTSTGGTVPTSIRTMPVPSVRKNPTAESMAPEIGTEYDPAERIRLPL